MSTVDPANPLTELHYEQIMDSLRKLDAADSAIIKAKQAGLDMTQQEALSRQQRTQLLQVKNTYFPNR